jgi:predicted nucleotidyltransferase
MDLTERLSGALANESDVRLAVLFGSTARGTSGPQSDLDIGVLGPAAPGRLSALAVLISRIAGRPADVIDLGTAPPLLRFEISREGIVLVERTSHAWTGSGPAPWWTGGSGRQSPVVWLRPRQPPFGPREPMVQRDIVGVRAARASARLTDAHRIFGQEPDAFVAAPKDRDLAIFYLFLALQKGIDLAAHWVADADCPRLRVARLSPGCRPKRSPGYRPRARS